MRTLRQLEATRHNWAIFQLKGIRANLLHLFGTESLKRKIDNFISELLQIEYAKYKRNKEKLNAKST